jgi:hypothetical protein
LQSVYCKTTLIDTEDCGCLLLFEAVKLLAQNQSIHTGSRRYQRRNNGFFARFFMTNTAPMLLIDPIKMAGLSMPILPRYVFIIIPMRKCAPNIPGK